VPSTEEIEGSVADQLEEMMNIAYPPDLFSWITRSQHRDAARYTVYNTQAERLPRVDKYDAMHWIRALLQAQDEDDRTYLRDEMYTISSAETNDFVSYWYYTVHDRYLGGRAPSISSGTTRTTISGAATSDEPTPSPPPRPPRSSARPSTRPRIPPPPRPPPTHGMSLRRRQ
jgi:hypothetical protein